MMTGTQDVSLQVLAGMANKAWKKNMQPSRTMTLASLRSTKADQDIGIRPGLQRMHAMLTSLPRARRQQAIMSLSEPLRRALIRHIETGVDSRARAAKNGIGFCCLPPVNHVESGSCALQLAVATPPLQVCHILGRSSVVASSRPRHQDVTRDVGGICEIRSRRSTQYFARITIDGVAISSQCTRRFDEACEFRSLLARVSASRPHISSAEAATPVRNNWLFAAFSEVAGQVGCKHQPLWSFRVLVDARKWIGRVISTRRFRCISEALVLRSRLEVACLDSWDTLRGVLTEHLPQRQRVHQLHGCGLEVTLSRLHFLDGCFAATQQRRQASWARAASLALARASRRSEGRALRLEGAFTRLATTLAKRLQRDCAKQSQGDGLLCLRERHVHVKGARLALLPSPARCTRARQVIAHCSGVEKRFKMSLPCQITASMLHPASGTCAVTCA